MKRLWVISFLISIVWGQTQSITLKKGDDLILINPKERIKIVTKENNAFKGPLSSFEISDAGIKVNDKWETIQSIQLYYPRKYAMICFIFPFAISSIEVLSSSSDNGGYSLGLAYMLFSGGFGYLAGYVIGMIVHFDKRNPLIINESNWQIVT